jgi:two-component system response regulator PilR (NtrC family)
MTMPIALIVDDEPDIRSLLSITLERMDIDCAEASTLAEARAKLERQRFDLCLTDLRLPDGEGLELVSHIQKSYAETPVAVITAHGTMETAIQALKSGAFDFVSKPLDINNLRSIIKSALRLTEKPTETGSRLIGESEAIRQIRSTITKLARSQAPVHISGESGTGKELVARMIHEQGPRGGKPFIPVNCGAIPQDLMESEFFGHKKGSFTGAVADKIGLFQAADGGTLFLDEVADLPLHMQVKLLRAIQERCVRPVGAQQEVQVDVRILSATHKDLAQLVREEKFRQDLFYRLNVIELKVPPLRERSEDIPYLVDHILSNISAQTHQTLPALTSEANRKLQTHPFPGNIRELENILERALTLIDGETIRPEDLRLPVVEQAPADPTKTDRPLEDFLDTVEKQKILAALEQVHGNKTAAAKVLGISFGALRYRLQKLGLD